MDGRDVFLTAAFTGYAPRPEQVVQYYRASSAVLALQNYNNTSTFEEEGTPDVSSSVFVMIRVGSRVPGWPRNAVYLCIICPMVHKQ